MPKTLFIEGRWMKEIILGDSVLEHLKSKGVKSVALFASVQFLELDTVRRQLEDEGMEVLTTKAQRTHVETQILGCDVYHDSFDRSIIKEADSILYVGDGLFHPQAILLSQREDEEIREVILWDPVAEKMRIIGYENIRPQLVKTRANLKKFISAQTVGVLVTIKPGQEFLSVAKKIKKRLEEQGKEVYIFMDDTLKYDQFESYPYIDAWVNTACPRIGLDDHVNLERPLINSREALDPVGSLERLHVKDL